MKKWWTQENPHIKKVLHLIIIIGALIFVPLSAYQDYSRCERLISECTAVTIGYVDDMYMTRISRTNCTRVIYHYEVNGTRYNAKEEYEGKVTQFSVSQSYPLHYNPDNPIVNYLGDAPSKGIDSRWRIVITIGAIIVAIDLIVNRIRQA